MIFLRKDRRCTVDKDGGGVILYFRNLLNCRRKQELEISNIETLWCEITFPNSRPFLLCSLCRPPSAPANWIDLFKAELSLAQTTGLEISIMGDFNIDYSNCLNKKWTQLVQLLDLKQMISSPTRVTQHSSSVIDHLYSTNPEHITDCFVPNYSISDHFPICFTRKINNKVTKSCHTTTTYRCFKTFDEELFLKDLSEEFSKYSISESDIEDDFSVWYNIFTKQLNQHAPVKTKRVKTKQMPLWFNPEITAARKNRDFYRKRKLWTEYKKYRNLSKSLIRKAKRQHFSTSVTNHKDTK